MSTRADGLVGMPTMDGGNINGDLIQVNAGHDARLAPSNYTVITLYEHKDSKINDTAADADDLAERRSDRNKDYEVVTCTYSDNGYCPSPTPSTVRSAH